MKKGLIFFAVAIFLTLVARFILTSPDFSPFDMKRIEDLIVDKGFGPDDIDKLNSEVDDIIDRGLIITYLSPNSYLLAVIVVASMFCYFVPIHLVIDKLFFKNFYQKASFNTALRRGFLFSLMILLLMLFKLYAVELYILALLPLLAILIEVLFVYYTRKSKHDEESDSVESKIRS